MTRDAAARVSSSDITSVFVGGPIQYARLPGADSFDRRLRDLIELTHVVLKLDGCEVLSAHRAENFGDGAIPTPAEVTARDFGYASECDIYVACLPCSDAAPYRTDGTHIEIGWVTVRRIPCVILWDQRHADRYSFLIQGLAGIGPVHFLDVERFMRDPTILPDVVRALSRTAVVSV